MSGDGESQPVAPEPADRDPRAVRGHRGDLPGPGPRPVEHDRGRRRHRCHRHRPADLRRRRPRRRLALYREHRGDRPVTAVIYTHSHIDHFGGVLGVVDADTDGADLAPEDFLEHAVSENVYAGTAMLRRGMYHDRQRAAGRSDRAGRRRPRRRRVRPAPSGCIAPTLDITHTGQEETLDGVRIVFQMTPGTEAPAEMNFHFPDQRRAVPCRERHPQPAQPADSPRRRRSATPRMLVAVHGRGDRAVRRGHRRRVRLPPLAHLGHREHRRRSCASNVTCTPTCTTRRCG